ncbi:hypothetical protein BN85406630 [Alteracholeplasma palmae J233]|uniref:Uncharacterized protein n=1 Tax=Alteracholeplasma palmae (strain ATCC 49389 / J233) TaxID=1318466 RepID=U4KPN7_ALTPJ|nr:hypothetical protein [Alteracholeplasma palmae]CCV64240.1 hypothetical protein BN85406630 [Alteracholeplasma palmae J233]
MKKKIILPILIITVLLTLTGGAYAYWASTVSGSNSNAESNVTVDQAGVVTTTLNVTAEAQDKILVPVGKEKNGVSVSKVTSSFSILWSGIGAEGTQGTLTATLLSVKAGGVEIDKTLFTLDNLSITKINVGTGKTVSLDIEFTNEPKDAKEYAKIAGKEITMTIQFSVFSSSIIA